MILLSTLLLPYFAAAVPDELPLKLNVDLLVAIMKSLPSDLKYTLLALSVALVCSTVNMAYVGPVSTDLMFER